jgi:hypothetical protein
MRSLVRVAVVLPAVPLLWVALEPAAPSPSCSA